MALLETTRPSDRLSGIVGVLRGMVLKLHPRRMWANPVMFVVEVSTLVAVGLTLSDRNPSSQAYDAVVTATLLLTLLGATFAEALAEARGRALATHLRKTRGAHLAHVVRDLDALHPVKIVTAGELRRGMWVLVTAGSTIPGDGVVLRGAGSVDESAMTGESSAVLKEEGDAVTGGTVLLSDRLVVEISKDPGETFLDRMIALVEGARRQKTPSELALGALLSVLTLLFLLVVSTLVPMVQAFDPHGPQLMTMVALLVCLIPTTIGALLSAIGIAGISRVAGVKVVATSGRPVEAAGDIDTLMLDKTGTITVGMRAATEFITMPGISQREIAEVALLASLADPTPEGRSVVQLARRVLGDEGPDTAAGEPVLFTARTRLSGIDLADGRLLRKGAVSAIRRLADPPPPRLDELGEMVARDGATPLAVAVDGHMLGIIRLEDVIKPGIRERLEAFRAMGIRTVMATGDNRITAAVIARDAGVDDFVAEATPEDKIQMIRGEQALGRLVAMTGDGTNDAPALAQADVGLVMDSGTLAAKEAGNLIDLDSDPTKLLDIVVIGKELLVTRGALTTFSIANDVAKYFAILPALFQSVPSLSVLGTLNIMHLTTPHGAILSALLFNALMIPALIPFAIRGVRYRPGSARRILARNMFNWGVLGMLTPFMGIWAIDRLLGLIGWG